MIYSMITKTIKSMITTVINPFDGLLSRYFVNLDPVLNSHYEMAAPITFSGDFEIECELSTTSTSSYNLIISPTSDSTWLALRGTGLVQMRVSPTDYLLSTSIINDGKLHKIKITKINNQFKMYIDEVLEDTSNSTSPYTSSFSFIGKWYNTQHYFDGIIANAKFTDQSGASDVTTTFKLNNSPAAENYTYGTELLDNNTFTNGTTNWYSPRNASSLSIIDNKLVSIADSTATFGAAQQIDNLIVGNVYIFKANIIKSNPSSIIYTRISTDSSLGSTIFNTSENPVNTIFTATATTMYIGVVVTDHVANDTVTIDTGITVKEITNYPEANAASEIEYSQENVFGSDEVVNGDFANGTANWGAVDASLASVGGELVITSAGTGSGSKKAQQTITGLEIGKLYSLTGSARRGTSTSDARILLEDVSLGFPILVNNSTTVTKTATIFFTATSTSTIIQADINSSTATGTCIFNNISVKEITNAVEYKNIPQSARELYSLEDDTWVGSNELVVNGDFATDSDWVSINDSSGAWSISNDLANVNCTSNAIFKNLGAVIKTGTFYLFSYELKNYVSGSVRLRVGSGLGDFQSANGIHSQIIEGIASSNNINFEANFSSGFIGSIDNVSIVEVIEVAS